MDKPIPASSLTKAPDNALAHYGVKGMKWGVRKSETAGKGPRMRNSSDYTEARKTQDRIERGGLSKVSNQELQNLVRRQNLEKQYRDLTRDRASLDAGNDAVKKILVTGATMNQVIKFTKSPAGKLIGNSLKLGLAWLTGGTSAAAAAGAQIALRNRRNHYTNVGGY